MIDPTSNIDPTELSAAAVIQDGPVDYPQPQPEFEPIEAPNTPEHEAFVAAIQARTMSRLAPAGVPADLIPIFGRELSAAVDELLTKFAIGQAKHGGDIRERDLDHELHQEIQDAFVYMICKRLIGKSIRIPFTV